MNKGPDAKVNPSYYGLDLDDRGRIIINVPMIHWNDFFVAPAAGGLGGHFGVLFYPTQPNVDFGDQITFMQFGKEIIRGVVVGLEKPGQAIRDDCADKLDKWKIHWVPTTPKALEFIAKKFSKIIQSHDSKAFDVKKSPSKRRRK